MTRALWLLLAALPLAAQPKLLVNAKLDTRSAASGLEREIRALLAAQPQPAWIAYSVPAVRNPSLGCEFVRDSFATAGVVHLEPPDHAVILYRVEGNAVNRIRSLSPHCEIDAGGVPVHWLTDVAPAQSVAFLASFAAERDRLGDSFVGAIAQHADPSADEALERFIAPNQPESLRQRTVSWYGSSRGKRGIDIIKKLIAGDPDQRIRERAVNALGSSREPEAVDLLTSLARTDRDPRIRQQAVSALGHKSGPAVLDTISKIIETDADVQVRQRAVSTLTSLPDGQGIPLLIQIVKTTQNTEVRKRAMSTLQQSRDPRAVAFFVDVLK